MLFYFSINSCAFCLSIGLQTKRDLPCKQSISAKHFSLFYNPFTFGGSGGILIIERSHPTLLRSQFMVTRSGLIYKPKETTMELEKSVQEMMQLLIEDCRKREDEIAAEHA